MEETLADVIGIFILIDMLVMSPVLAAPHEGGVLKRRRAKEQGEKAHCPVGLESEVGEEPVITERNAHPSGENHEKKKRHLKPVEAEVPDVDGDSGQGQEKGAYKENARLPVDAFHWDVKEFH